MPAFQSLNACKVTVLGWMAVLTTLTLLISTMVSSSGVLGLRWQGPAGYYRRLLDLPEICHKGVTISIKALKNYPRLQFVNKYQGARHIIALA